MMYELHNSTLVSQDFKRLPPCRLVMNPLMFSHAQVHPCFISVVKGDDEHNAEPYDVILKKFSILNAHLAQFDAVVVASC
jgi:hypothetical protein